MKKRSIFKKLVSIALTAVMALSIAIPVHAEVGDPLQTGSLTINKTKVGETYTLYKIFDLTWSANDLTTPDADCTEGNHAYTVTDEFAEFFTTEKLKNMEGDTFDLKAAAYINSRKDDLADLATELKKYILNEQLTPAKVVAGAEGTTVATGLLYGYYIMIPSDTLATDGLSALFSLDTVKPNAQINNKSQYPTVDKEIVEGNDRVETNTASIGDVINYEVTSFVPNMAGYQTYKFYFTDTFAESLTFNNDVAIKMVKEGKTKNLAADEFSVSQTGQVVIIDIKNFQNYDEDWMYADVIVTYSATLNDKAIVGNDGNENKVNLTYSSNPAVESVLKRTADDYVETFATSVALKKVDEEGNVLNGAQFKITGEQVNMARTYGQKFVANSTGTYYKLKDGWFTQTVANDATKDLYASTTQKYALVELNETQTKTSTVDINGYVDANGKLVMEGFGEGVYEIVEMVAPNGYHLLAEPIHLSITCTLPDDVVDGSAQCTWKVSMTNANDEEAVPTVDAGVINLQVENQTDTEMPFTGGEGIALFGSVGLVFVVAAALVVMASKKKVVTE